MIVYEWIANLWILSTSIIMLIASLVFLPASLDILFKHIYEWYKSWSKND